MKKIISIILLAVIIPQVAFAAWWNPVSWFRNDDKVLENKVLELESRLDEQNKEEGGNNESGVLPREESKAQTKVITQTITVDNPDPQKRINALIEENIALQAKVISQSSLVQQLNSCKADLVDLRTQLNKPTAEPENSTQAESQISGPVIFGKATCRDNYIIDLPITFTGVSNKYAVAEISSDSRPSSKQGISPTSGTKLVTIPFTTGSYKVRLTLSTEPETSLSYKYDPTAVTYSTEFSITTDCINR